MGKIIETIINRFDGGLSEDKRVKSANKYSLTKHFDAFTYPHKLVPHYKTETVIAEDDIAHETFSIVKFLYAPATARGANEYRLFGFGKYYGTDLAAIYDYNIDDSFSTPRFVGASTDGTKYKSDIGIRNEDVFFYYKNFIYFWAGKYLQAYDTTGSAAINEGFYDASSAPDTVCQPVHHTSDIAYFFHDNFVHTLNDTSWSAKVLTLPSANRIVAACAYGNYLAIGCINKDFGTITGADFQSTVYLWDRDSGLATLTARIDFGRGKLLHLATLDNKLIGVVNNYADGQYGLKKGKIYIKQASDNTTVILNEITTDARIDADSTGVAFLPRTNFVKENKLYFPMRADLNGDERNGIWVVDSLGRISLDFVEEAVATDKYYQGIYQTGNMWWIAHSGDGSVTRTDDGATYSSTLASTYESLILGDSHINKKLI